MNAVEIINNIEDIVKFQLYNNATWKFEQRILKQLRWLDMRELGNMEDTTKSYGGI